MTIVDNKLLQSGRRLRYLEGMGKGLIFEIRELRNAAHYQCDREGCYEPAHDLIIVYKPPDSHWYSGVGEIYYSIPDNEIVREDLFKKDEPNI